MNQSVDLEALSALKDIMEDEFDTLVTTYINDATQRLTLLPQLLAVGDLDEVRKNAHSLKGSSGNLGASLLSDLCFQIEDQARRGISDELERLIDHAAEEFLLVKGALQNGC